MILSANVDRVAGLNDVSGTLLNNYARAGMDVIDAGSTTNPIGMTANLNDEMGCDVSQGTASGQYNNEDFWTGLGWDFVNVWKMSGGLPVLR